MKKRTLTLFAILMVAALIFTGCFPFFGNGDVNSNDIPAPTNKSLVGTWLMESREEKDGKEIITKDFKIFKEDGTYISRIEKTDKETVEDIGTYDTHNNNLTLTPPSDSDEKEAILTVLGNDKEIFIMVLLPFAWYGNGNLDTLVGSWNFYSKAWINDEYKIVDVKMELNSDNTYKSYQDHQLKDQGKWEYDKESSKLTMIGKDDPDNEIVFWIHRIGNGFISFPEEFFETFTLDDVKKMTHKKVK